MPPTGRATGGRRFRDISMRTARSRAWISRNESTRRRHPYCFASVLRRGDRRQRCAPSRSSPRRSSHGSLGDVLATVLDFTSALYLGLRHASVSLRPWAQLTGGVPYALGTPPLARIVAQQLAGLIGTERATLARSTLHAFWDLFVILADGAPIYVDASAYPIAQWGIERAAGRGVPAHRFARHDPDDLRRRLRATLHARSRPIV